MKGSATMNSAVNESPYGVLESDRERIMPTMIAMAGKKNIAIVAHAHGIGLRPIHSVIAHDVGRI